ncbi:MAG: hypothetical protein ACJ762_03975 [Solirubrobacteraceae bacterium]
MKKFASLALVGASFAVLPAAADASQSHGFLRSFENGKLTLFNRSLGKTVYIVNAKTDCGVSFGQSGDQIPCKTLGSAKYADHKVFVRWTRNAAGKRVATSLGVDMSNG